MVKRILLLFSLLLLAFVAVKVTKLDKDERFLNYFAKYYFDEQYYVAHYPEILEQKIDPFEHYVTVGWKQGKNPNSEFDSTLYSNLYLLYNNKYDLNPLAHYCYSLLSLKDRYTNANQLNKAEVLEKPKYYLALVAIFRDEAPYLKEWIEFYRTIGVEHFYLHNHLSKDNYAEALKTYIDEGVVTLSNVSVEAKDKVHWNKIQNSAYFSTIQEVKDKVEWLVIVDTDEFLFPVKEMSLANALKEYDDYAGLAVNWRIFGSSNVKKIPSDKLLIETLVMKGDEKDTHVKSIVKPRYVEEMYNPHFPVFMKGYEKINENFEYFSGPFLPYESRHTFRINHYWSRDLEFFYNRKVSRVHVINNQTSEGQAKAQIRVFIDQDKRNSSIYDGSILKYIDEMRDRIFN